MPVIGRRRFAAGLALAPLAAPALLAAGARSAAAQTNYPSRPVRVILPFAAGGVADVTSRLTAEKLSAKFGQRFIIENQPGAGGINAARSVITATADGYTLGLVTNGTAISVPLFKALPFDPLKDFALISSLGYFDLVFLVNSASRFKTLNDFVKAAREQPGKLNVGTINVGSTQNLGAELFKSTTHTQFQIIPYRTTPDVIVALLRNDVDMLIDFYAGIRAGLQDGKLRAIAVSGKARSASVPDVPTVEQAGIAGYDVESWNGMFAPRDTPAAIIDTLNKALREILAISEIKEQYAKVGIEAKASTPQELRARLEADIAKWARVIEQAHIPKQ